MHISFRDNKLLKVFNSEKDIYKKFGVSMGRVIMHRMATLQAAPSLADVSYRPPERRHELTGSRKGEFAVDVKNPYRLVFKPNHNPLPYRGDGGLELSKITAITILQVEDYH